MKKQMKGRIVSIVADVAFFGSKEELKAKMKIINQVTGVACQFVRGEI